MTMTTAIPMRDYFGIWSLSLLASIFLFLAPLSGRELGTRHRDSRLNAYYQPKPRQSPPIFANLEQPAFPENPVLEIDFLSDIVSSLSRIPAQSLTVVLPVSSASLPLFPRRLFSLIGNSSATSFECLHEVIIVYPDTITSSLRVIAASLFSSEQFQDKSLPDVSLHPFRERLRYTKTLTSGASLHHAAIEAAKFSGSTSWVLLLDETALDNVSPSAQATLLCPPSIPHAFGFLGHTRVKAPSAPSQWGLLRPATYITTPLVASLASLRSSRLLASVEKSNIRLTVSTDYEGGFDQNYTSSDNRPSGGLVVIEQPGSQDDHLPMDTLRYANATQDLSDLIYFFLPSEAHIETLASLFCNLRGAKAAILLYSGTDRRECSTLPLWSRKSMRAQCMIDYDVLAPVPFDGLFEVIIHWMKTTTTHENAVIFALKEEGILSAYLTSARFKAAVSSAPPVILIPEDDLPYSDWISSLSVPELKSTSYPLFAPPLFRKLTVHYLDWHLPKVEISVVTKDRPRSLRRLISSLSNAQYFGDAMDIRLNIEQDCDSDTLKVVKKLTWPFGTVFVNHRVLHAGLLPAVVESWYPKDDHTYGVILEDDIEVSPMFYAWIKMGLLKYRYGSAKNRSPYLFGISLYQHKHMELRTQGRKAFNPRTFFKDAGLTHSNTAYLSQVPCSWGAVYFPEHWREFHDYLAVRLSPASFHEQPIVPNVRSNYWSQSWKKFFIELVYLRGYLMLYPNFPDFVSLSTNHLEVGSHVKSRSQARKDLFTLPLMRPLPAANGTTYSTGLLQLPNKRLPHLPELPMINLTGTLIGSHTQLIEAGQHRRHTILNCAFGTELYDVRSLMCINGSLASENI